MEKWRVVRVKFLTKEFFLVGKLPRIVPLVLLVAAGCAKDSQRAVTPGQTSEAELVQQLGPAQVSGASLSRPAASQRTYSDCEYQVESGQVVARFCAAQDHEKTLQYWRQLWRTEELSFTPVSGESGPHGPDRYVLRAHGLKMAVIYSRSRDRVIQVIHYAAVGSDGMSPSGGGR